MKTRLPIVPVLLFVAILVGACSGKPEKTILGKWELESYQSGPRAVFSPFCTSFSDASFLEDGVFRFSDGTSYTYSFQQPNYLTIGFAGLGQTYVYELTGDSLRLVEEEDAWCDFKRAKEN
jgi:hypothetical protein